MFFLMKQEARAAAGAAARAGAKVLTFAWTDEGVRSW
jgi:hypothetical protein